MSGAVSMQLEQLQERFRGAEVRQMEGDTKLVIVPDIRLPAGWSKTSTTIWFIIPSGYPFAPLDCFWADQDLRLANGMQPQNSGCNPVPGHPDAGLWFSWHLQGQWNPNRDTLSTWMNVVIDRLRKVV